MIRPAAFATMVTILSLGAGMAAQAQVIEPQLQQTIAASDPNEPVAVIVTLSSKKDLIPLKRLNLSRAQILPRVVTELRNHAALTQLPILNFMRGHAASHLKQLWIINGLAAEIPAGAIDDLAALPGVESVRLDAKLSAPEPQPALAVLPEWNISAIKADSLWALGFTGQGVIVASMDTGVDVEHPDLAPRWRGGTNSWFDPYGQHSSPTDQAGGPATGHGTQVMGLIVGGDFGGTSVGVAPGANWIAVKIFDDTGTAQLSKVHEGFQWLLDPDQNLATNDAPDIVNASFGFTNAEPCDLEFQPDIGALKLAGIAVVVAAGNSGPGPATSVSPANYPESFAVGAVDSMNVVAGFSSRGPSACDATIFPEVVAPGIDVFTTDLSFGGMGLYLYVSGTSAAAPHASGAMALLLSANPNLTPLELEVGLKESALDVGPFGVDNDTGHGLIDVMEAYIMLGGSAPTDADGDGYVASVDCNDNDPAAYPGAVEVKFDGVDQDCNGYDLTIRITKAIYVRNGGRLLVEATSRLGAKAQLVVVGYGPMKWSRALKRWILIVGRIGAHPGVVTVSGIEGMDTAPVAPPFKVFARQ